MSADDEAIRRTMAAHYSREDLGAAILDLVRARGGDPDHPMYYAETRSA